MRYPSPLINSSAGGYQSGSAGKNGKWKWFWVSKKREIDKQIGEEEWIKMKKLSLISTSPSSSSSSLLFPLVESLCSSKLELLLP